MRGGARPSKECESGGEINQHKARKYNFRIRRDRTCTETLNSMRFRLETPCNQTTAEPSADRSARAGRGCRAKNDTVAARSRVVARLITQSVWHGARRIGISLWF